MIGGSNGVGAGVIAFKKILVISGPSGSGKSTLIKRLFNEYPNKFGFSVSHTTRVPRVGEIDGKDYHFTTKSTFEGLREKSFFIENAEFSGNYYGTSYKAVEDVLNNGKFCILDIDLQGVHSMKKSIISNSCKYVFIRVPSFADLRTRLELRGTESVESLVKRLEIAEHDCKFVDENEGFFDIDLVNEDLEKTYKSLNNYILSLEEIST